jgi:putative heme iron utilization protein
VPHESRLTIALRTLLQSQRVASLGTIGDDGAPYVSMVPYVLAPSVGCLVIHVSGLAAHTRNLQTRTNVSLLVMKSEVRGESVHALPRVTLTAAANVLAPNSPQWQTCRDYYLARFPETEPMTRLGDFMFVGLEVKSARHVAGFGTARSIDDEEVRLALG